MAAQEEITLALFVHEELYGAAAIVHCNTMCAQYVSIMQDNITSIYIAENDLFKLVSLFRQKSPINSGKLGISSLEAQQGQSVQFSK